MYSCVKSKLSDALKDYRVFVRAEERALTLVFESVGAVIEAVEDQGWCRTLQRLTLRAYPRRVGSALVPDYSRWAEEKENFKDDRIFLTIMN